MTRAGGEPRRTHPVTPLVTMVRAIVPIAIFMFVMEGRDASDMLGLIGAIALHAGPGAWRRWFLVAVVVTSDLLLR